MNNIALSAIAFCFATAISAQNHALLLDGISSASIGNGIPSGIHSIEFWIKPHITYDASLDEPASILIRNDNGPDEDGEYGFYFAPSSWAGESGRLVFHNTTGTTRYEVISDATTWDAFSCHHVAGVIHPQSGMQLYIDGVLQNDSEPTTTAIQAHPESVYFGKWGNLNTRYYNGELDEVRFWSEALTQQQIQTRMFNELNPANEPALMAYWTMNEGSGSIIADLGPNGYDGTLFEAGFTRGYCLHNAELAEQAIIHVDAFPNPASECITFSFDEPLTNVICTLYTISGEEVLREEEISANVLSINLTALPAGLYVADFTTADGRVLAIRKVLVTD